MLALRDAVPRRMTLAWAEFATLRQRLLKIGARVVEKAARIRIHFASACPDAAPVPPAGRAPRRLGPLIAGAPCPAKPEPVQPQTPTLPTSNPGAARRRTPTRARIKSTDKLRPP